MHIVTQSEIELSTPQTVAVTATAKILSYSRLGRTRRTSICITPLTAGVTVTVVEGEIDQCVANAGYVLQQYQPFLDSDQSGAKCWQGAVCVVASGAGNISVSEIFANPQEDDDDDD